MLRPAAEAALGARWLVVAVAIATAAAAGVVMCGPLWIWPAATLLAVGALYASYRWPFAFIVLMLWTAVIPTFYLLHVGSIGVAPYLLFEVLAITGLTLRALRGRIRVVVPPGASYLAIYILLTSISAVFTEILDLPTPAGTHLEISWRSSLTFGETSF